MRTLKLNKILEYYDVPQIFIANDKIGTHYLCVLYDQTDDGYKYLAVQISVARLTSFISGHEDLRDLYIHPSEDGSLFNVIVKDSALTAYPLSEKDLVEEMLPLEGYFFDHASGEDDEDNIIIAETIERNHPIIRLGFEDEKNSHTIDASCLSQALAVYQTLVTNCFRKVNGKELASQAELRVTTFQAASFDVHFQVNAPLNLLGSSDMDSTFKELDKLFMAPTEEDFIKAVKTLKGHTIQSYQNFLEVLMENRLNVKYRWVSSIVDKEIIRGKMCLPKIERFHDILNRSKELQSEERTFRGVFLASSVENGKWTFRAEGERKNINGISENNDLLSGVVIEQQNYDIFCDEIQTQNIASARISKKLKLRRIVPAATVI